MARLSPFLSHRLLSRDKSMFERNDPRASCDGWVVDRDYRERQTDEAKKERVFVEKIFKHSTEKRDEERGGGDCRRRGRESLY